MPPNVRRSNRHSIREAPQVQDGGLQTPQEAAVQAMIADLRRELNYSLLKVPLLTILFLFIIQISITRMTEDFLWKHFREVTCIYLLAFYFCHHYFLRRDMKKITDHVTIILGIQEQSESILNSFEADQIHSSDQSQSILVVILRGYSRG